MAGIDKTYTDSYENYTSFKEWAKSSFVTFYDGYKICIGYFVYDYQEDDFSNGSIPIMNSPTWLDIYLIQNCPIKFVIERLKSVYDKSDYEEFQNFDLTAKPQKEFEQKRKIKINKHNNTKFPIHSKPYGKVKYWWLQCSELNYNEETKTWASYDSYYPTYTNVAHIKSLKGIIRHLRKQYLPKGIKFYIFGRYTGEDYVITIS